jgi:hypothetical protein
VRAEPTDGRADLYSLGAILWEVCTGGAAVTGNSAIDVLTRQLLGDIRPPSSVNQTLPAWFDSLVMRCLQKSPDDRFQSATELKHALQTSLQLGEFRAVDATRPGLPSALAGTGASRTPVVTVPVSDRAPIVAAAAPRWRWPLAVAALVSVAVGVTIVAMSSVEIVIPTIATIATIAGSAPAAEFVDVRHPSVSKATRVTRESESEARMRRADEYAGIPVHRRTAGFGDSQPKRGVDESFVPVRSRVGKRPPRTPRNGRGPSTVLMDPK